LYLATNQYVESKQLKNGNKKSKPTDNRFKNPSENFIPNPIKHLVLGYLNCSWVGQSLEAKKF
jgi:hypothetical protein